MLSLSLQPTPTIHEPDEAENDALFVPDWRFYLAFSALCIIVLAAALDATSLSVALPIMANKLHGTAIEAFWAGTSFLLTSTVFQPSYASLSHIFGRKPLLYVAIFLFAIGAIIAALSHDFTSILVGRSWQGIGAGGILCLTEVIITDLVPLKVRGKWFGALSAVWAIGSVTGPIVGGAFAQSVSWTWIFWLNLPILVIGFIMTMGFLHLNQQRNESISQKLKRVDWIGTILFVGSTTSLLIPVTWGGVMYSWSHPRTLGPFCLGLFGLAFFVYYENKWAKEPLIRFSIFNNITASLVYFQAFVHGIVLWSLLYFGPFFFEGVRGFSPMLSGVGMFPETFTIAPIAGVVGVLVSILGTYRWALWIGWGLTCIGFGLLYLEDGHTPNAIWISLNIVPGIGMGMLFTSMALAVLAAVKPIDVAYAASFFTFMRTFGNCIGVAVAGAIFQNQMKHNLKNYPLLAAMADQFSEDSAALVEIIKIMPNSPMRDQLIQSYADGLKVVWAAMSALSGIAFLCNFGIKAYTLKQALVTEQGFLQSRRNNDVEKEPTKLGKGISSSNSVMEEDGKSLFSPRESAIVTLPPRLTGNNEEMASTKNDLLTVILPRNYPTRESDNIKDSSASVCEPVVNNEKETPQTSIELAKDPGSGLIINMDDDISHVSRGAEKSPLEASN